MPKIKIWNIVMYAALFLLFSWSKKIVGLWTDFYWFQELGAAGVLKKMAGAQIGLGLAAGLAVFAILLLHWWIAQRRSTRLVGRGPPVPKNME